MTKLYTTKEKDEIIEVTYDGATVFRFNNNANVDYPEELTWGRMIKEIFESGVSLGRRIEKDLASKTNILELIEKLKDEVDEDSNGYFIEDCKTMENIEFQQVQSNKVLAEHRWYNIKENVYRIGEQYLGVRWRDPATENQEGQDTHMEFYQVFPNAVMEIKYERK